MTTSLFFQQHIMYNNNNKNAQRSILIILSQTVGKCMDDVKQVVFGERTFKEEFSNVVKLCYDTFLSLIRTKYAKWMKCLNISNKAVKISLFT